VFSQSLSSLEGQDDTDSDDSEDSYEGPETNALDRSSESRSTYLSPAGGAKTSHNQHDYTSTGHDRVISPNNSRNHSRQVGAMFEMLTGFNMDN